MNSNPNPTETPVAINPGIMKEWFKMYLPMRVVPVRSKLMAATVALLSMLSGYNISLMNILMISVPCTLLGVLVGAIYSLKVGKELDQDPEYLKRVANHEFSTEHYEAKGVENQMKAALSVSIFVLATIAIVIFGSMESLRPVFTVGTEKVSMQMSHIIEVLMLTASAFILLFTKTDGIKAAVSSCWKRIGSSPGKTARSLSILLLTIANGNL